MSDSTYRLLYEMFETTDYECHTQVWDHALLALGSYGDGSENVIYNAADAIKDELEDE